MKNKSLIITCSIIVVLIIVLTAIYFILGSNKVTISFDSDGGTPVESIKVNKGGTAKLPTPTKEKSKFDGWYHNDAKANENSVFTEDITLKAHWVSETKIKVTFETDGGSQIEPIFLEENEEFKEPDPPTKEGYTFFGWYDQNEVPISTGALFAEDIVLYAKWEKAETVKYTVNFDSNGGSKVNPITVAEGSKLTLPKEPTKDNSVFVGWFTKSGSEIKNGATIKENTTLYARWKKYTCPTGYTLNDKKCTIETSYKTKCGERGFDYEGKCITLTLAARKDADKDCGTKTVILPYGHTEEVKGDIFKIGTYYCFYKQVTDSYEQQSSSNCTSRGHKWNSQNNRCYYDRDEANVNITNTCASGYAYIANPNTYSGVNGLNGGCFPVTDKEKYCDDGYKLSNNKCIKTIDATLE